MLIQVQCWNFETIYGGQEPSRNRVVIPARQATQPGGIDSWESILGLLKSLKNRAQYQSLQSPDLDAKSAVLGCRMLIETPQLGLYNSGIRSGFSIRTLQLYTSTSLQDKKSVYFILSWEFFRGIVVFPSFDVQKSQDGLSQYFN